MNSHGFSQLVNQPTTDNGTLIDHIYIRNTTSLNTNIEVHDAYYSDHDCILTGNIILVTYVIFYSKCSINNS